MKTDLGNKVEKKLSFEEAMSQLESIIEEMEDGKLPLEKSIERFEEAVELVKFCNKKLDSYEKKLSVVLENKDGSLNVSEVIKE